MSSLTWFDLYPPRGLDLPAVIGLMRPLASRPRVGLMQRTPVVVLEAWVTASSAGWLLGMDPRLTASVPGQFQAHLPRLGLKASACPTRPAPSLGADVRLSSFAFPLRLDTAEAVSAGVLAIGRELRADESAVLQWIVGPSYQRSQRPDTFNLAEALGFRTPTPPTAPENQAWRAKASEALYGVRGRAAAQAATTQRATTIIRSLVGALSLANSSHCAIRTSPATERRARDVAAVRQPSVTWSSVVSSAELAVLLGWPLGKTGATSQLAPAPAKLLMPPGTAQRTRGSRVLGASLHPADHGRLVTMPLATSHHNVQVVGPTGSGKSTELAQLILADAEAGHGVLVIEPRGDLVADVLARLPKHRHGDLVIIDPSEDDQVGFNPLAGPIRQAEQRADELVGLFRAVYGSAIGPRSSDLLFHALLTAARMPDGTLADVPILLSSPPSRRRALAAVGDPLVLRRWWARFESLSIGEQQQVTAPVMNKLTPFLARQPIRRALSQSNPKFSFDDFFQERPQIVLVSLNRGVIGSEAAQLLGSLLLSAAWAACQRRATLPKSKRFPVMLVLDEFQDYVGALDFGQVLAQCRGLGASITAAHQHLLQLDAGLRAAVTANARSRLSFRPSQDDARPLAAVFGEPVTPDDLLELGAFQVCARLLVDSAMTPPFAIQTLPLPEANNDVAALRRSSREHYATDGQALDEALVRRWHGEDNPPDAPVGTRRRSS